MRAIVIGHVEWIEFLRVESVPKPGEIVHAPTTWAEAAGGGAVAAVQLANLGCETLFFTALGDDDLGRGLGGARVEGPAPPRRLGARASAPRHHIRGRCRGAHDHGDRGEAPAARRRQVTALGGAPSTPTASTSRAGTSRRSKGAACARPRRHGARAADAPPGRSRARCARRQRDRRGRTLRSGRPRSAPRLFVATSGQLGGWAQPGGPFAAVTRSGPVVDAYGAGDCFAAGLTFALASGEEPRDALAFAAHCGATVVTGRGPYERQLTARSPH